MWHMINSHKIQLNQWNYRHCYLLLLHRSGIGPVFQETHQELHPHFSCDIERQDGFGLQTQVLYSQCQFILIFCYLKSRILFQ